MNPLKDILKEKKITYQNVADLLGTTKQNVSYKVNNQRFMQDELEKIFDYWGFDNEDIGYALRGKKSKESEIKELKKMIISLRKEVAGG